jgi:hypothetical protein
MHALILFMLTVAQDPQLQMRQQLMAMRYHRPRWVDGAEAGASAEAAPKNCAIPLLNTLVGKMPENPMPVVKPEGQFHIRQVTPPAPPCENWGK